MIRSGTPFCDLPMTKVADTISAEDFAALHKLTRFEVKVPVHVRERVTSLAKTLGCGQAEAFIQAVQQLESMLDNADAIRYRIILQRRICAPPGARGDAMVPGTLPPIPELVPPVMTSYAPPEVIPIARAKRIADLTTATPPSPASPQAGDAGASTRSKRAKELASLVTGDPMAPPAPMRPWEPSVLSPPNPKSDPDPEPA